tara:strand:+ start:92 stop:439 length:348 start_codon:yes stop_codon:yes gene_type:complete
MKIKINNMVLYGFHGLYDDEKKNGQRFIINLECKLKQFRKIDKINESVNYVSIMDSVFEIFNHKKYNLIESLADDICSRILKFDGIAKISVSIKKPDAPINYDFDSVEVECEKKK